MKEKGVALIQVLLISSMLLILVVQLSQGARDQVQTSIQLKDKTDLLIALTTQMEEVKFELLTSPMSASGNSNGLNLYGKPVIRRELSIELRDQSGMMSLGSPSSFLVDYLGFPQQTPETRSKEKSLRIWQALEDTTDAPRPPNYRGGFIHYAKELEAIPGWNDVDGNDTNLTYYPTNFFNPLMAPEDVLYNLFPNESVSSIIEARESGQSNLGALLLSLNLLSRDNIALVGSDFFYLKVTAQKGELSITREVQVLIKLGSNSLLRTLSL
jgi:general secretion pathway protein K